MRYDLEKVVSEFRIYGDFVEGAPYGSGHINDTFAVVINQSGRDVRYILQRVNDVIFKDVPGLMENIARVTEHSVKKLNEFGESDVSRKSLSLVKTIRDEDYLYFENSTYWRCYFFIENANTYDVIDDPKKALEAARSFGEFQKTLADIPGGRLNETIPNFHNTRDRFNKLAAAVERDSAGRASSVQPEIQFFKGREEYVDVVIDKLKDGSLPERVTHNDTKLNNVMLDDGSMEAVCVIDLDTLMPGSSLYDFGDMIRTATNAGLEDEKDLSKVFMQMPVFEALVEGFLGAVGKTLTDEERSLLAFSGKLITMETGMRFLTDYLEGDAYFKTKYSEHNLDRCRTQIKLVQSIEENESAMNDYVVNFNKK